MIFLAFGAGCSAPGAPGAPAPTPGATAGGEIAASPPASTLVARRPLGEAREVALPVHLVPSRDRRACLAVHDDPEHRRSYYRRIDEGGPGPLALVDGRRVVASLELSDGPRIVTSDGRRVCIGDRCHEVTASFALALADRRLALLEERLVEPEAADASPEPNAPKPTKVERPEVAVWVHPLDATGAADGEAFESGLRFIRPLDGMGMIDAIATPRGAVLLHYAEASPRREGKREVARAKLMTATLDAEGKMVKRSARKVLEGDRRFGFIEGHHRQRLHRFGDEVIVVGRHVDPSQSPAARFEAHRLDGRALPGSDALFGVDPDRLARGVDAETATRLSALFDRAPRLVMGQPGSDAGRVAWVGDRGWFLIDGTPTATDGREAAITARRARLRWAHLEPDGEGIAGLEDAIVHVARDGSLSSIAGSVELLGPPVKVGDTFWGIRRTGDVAGATVTRLWPGRLDGPAATAGETVLGAGMILRRRGGALRIDRLAGDGRTEPLAVATSPFDGRFLAAGAVIAGERGGEILVATVETSGALSSPISLGAGALEGLERRRDGALLTSERRVVWLDAEGRPIAEAPRPAPAHAPPCVDGHPAPSAVPLGPGVLQPFPTPEDACVVSEVVAFDDGALRWLGSQVRGADAQAEIVDVAAPIVAASGEPKLPKWESRELPRRSHEPICPAEMVAVGNYCVDRYEARLAGDGGELLSPDYPPSPALVATIFKAWAFGRFYEGDLHARAMPLPPLGRAAEAEPRFLARSERLVAPSGYLSGYAAKQACEAAGKRLCRHDEWVRACRGEAQTKFPYGDDYVYGACNVFRFDHPARILHGNAAIGHLDPRLNQVDAADGPMRRDTGASPRCASRWGDDAIYDMVGNLDEWVDVKSGAFAGGFYARATRTGCDALISVHPRRYLDYSLGVRCCRDARREP